MKRAFDLFLALGLVLPAALIVAVAAIVVRMDSPGSPLFLQQRVGRYRRPFLMVKLRTMAQGTASRGSHEVSASQITRVGAFLRRTKIDELPQVWSVLVGDMSFVGPRPCLPVQQELIEERDARGVFAVRPGITGPAQLAGIDMSTPRELAIADAEYLASHSVIGDIGMIAATALGRGSGDAAGRAGR